jgi:hypothetical protein
MRKFGVNKNASGYYDDTAYKAMTAGPQPGEIWTNRKGDLPSLILANNGPLCLCLKMYEDYMDGEIRVMGRVPMYVNPLKVTYARTADLMTYVKSIPGPEFKVIHRACVRALGIAKE